MHNTEKMFVDIAFAEEREIRHMKNISGRFTVRIESLFTAITFTGAGELNTARDFMGGDSGDSKRPVGCCLPDFCAGRA
ncbi:MAG TPA: hypothetical protein VFG09_00635 [Thermodesulfovibrionales bacterium]|jgi:hypothetical protein|nr:hypothetical protein [Thermodesulfovibrionales bacterium]